VALRFGVFLLVLSWGVASASAWEIKTTSSGKAVQWPAGPVVVELSLPGHSEIHESMAEEQAISAFSNWEHAVDSEIQFDFSREESRLPTANDGLNVIRWGLSSTPLTISGL
jgi:hypothetical protein